MVQGKDVAHGPAWTFRLGLLTPALGGGMKPGEVEEDRPFRIPSIRGQLRFWWRATQGARFPLASQNGRKVDYRPIREAEALLWGMASVAEDDRRQSHQEPMASAVRVALDLVEDPGHRLQRRKVTDDRAPMGSGLGYLFFPAREIRGANARDALSYWWGPMAKVRVELDLDQVKANLRRLGSFRDRTLDAALQEDLVRQVAAALWAWGHFGGIGARTRRGAGAVVMENVQGPHQQWLTPVYRSVDDVLKDFKKAAEFFVAGEARHAGDIPVLKGAWVAVSDLTLGPSQQRPTRGQPGAPLAMPERVAEAVGRTMQDFRQGVGFARNPGQGPRPGRSRWPEPDAIRRLLRRWAPNHQPRLPTFFPRAALGLPIVFKFNTTQARGDPEGQITLFPGDGLQRMASPVILRPLRLEGQDRYALVCLLLNTPLEPPGGLVLVEGARQQGQGTPVPPQAEALAGLSQHGRQVEPLKDGGGGPAPWALLCRIAANQQRRMAL